MPHKKQRRNLRLGVLGMVLCMAADWLLDVKPAGNVSSGVVESGWPEMSMWRFEASILIAAAIIPLFWLGSKTLMELILQHCRTNTDRHMECSFHPQLVPHLKCPPALIRTAVDKRITKQIHIVYAAGFRHRLFLDPAVLPGKGKFPAVRILQHQPIGAGWIDQA